MAYIPKSQIKANQFTPGNEWFYIKDNSEYTGFYYLLSNGRAFTGKDQNSPPNDEMFNKHLLLLFLRLKIMKQMMVVI